MEKNKEIKIDPFAPLESREPDSMQKRFCPDCEVKTYNNRKYLRRRKKQTDIQ